MYKVPDVEEVVAVAKELGIHLSPDEAVLYRKYLLEQLSQFDAFVQARLEEPRPPMISTARKPGYRPTPEEDPLNAWTWKCRIEGAAEGVLDLGLPEPQLYRTGEIHLFRATPGSTEIELTLIQGGRVRQTTAPIGVRLLE